MANNINVTLDTSVTPNVLDVNDKGNNKVDHNTKPQTISWNLTGNLAQGQFVPMCDPEPGFEWLAPVPPDGIFGTPTIGANGNSLDLVDNHADATSNGTWAYRLRVSLGDAVYETTDKIGIAAASNRPIIINQ